jgi:aspartate aminotransferase
MRMLSQRVKRIGFSPTLGVSDLAGRLRAEGIDVLDLSAGQPDFPTPEPVKAAGSRAIAENKTGYTDTSGIAPLREAIAARIERDLGVRYAPDQVLVSPGAKTSLYFGCMALLDPGDEVLVLVPYWASHTEQIRLADAVPVWVTCHEAQGFKLAPADLEAAVTPRTKALILNYPSNPTGASYNAEELAALAAVCLRHHIWIIADEIYSKLLYDGRTFASVAAVDPEVAERTLLIDGMSKAYSMTGWRVGYAAGPRELISGMACLQSHCTSNATSISQWASLAALRELSDGELTRRRDEFERRRDVILAGLGRIPGLACVKPQGAFFVFPNVSGCFGRGRGAALGCGDDLARYLLEVARVAVVPGEGFGSPDHVRISYAAPLERIEEGLRRIARALEALG